MKSRLAWLFSLIVLSLTGHAAGTAERIYVNGRIYTANDALPWVEAVAIDKGRFSFVGDSARARQYAGPATKVIDLQGRMAMPGIHDAHSHMTWGGLNRLYECRLPLGATLESLIDALHECGEGLADDEWLVAGSVWSEQFPGKRFHRRHLDAAFPDRPVYVVEGSQHHAFLNSRALEAAGIDKNTTSPSGGRLEKDQDGELTGELVENATTLAARFLRIPPLEHHHEALRWASKLFSRYGITSTQESSANLTILQTLRDVDNERALKQRVAAHIIWGSPKFARASDAEMEKLIDRRQAYASQHVRTDFVKMWIDGSPTPPFFTEGSINHETKEVDLQSILIPPKRLNAFVTRLDKQGIKMKLHVAGAGATHVALDAFAVMRKANSESGIVHELGHANLVLPSDFPRMQRLNIAADMSPTIWHLYGPTLGNPPLPAWQFRTMQENGVLMSMGTDWPVTDDPNIFPALAGLLDRGYESLDLDTGLKMMTINGATAMGWQAEQGSVEKGKLADLVVLDRHLFEVANGEVGGTRVLHTLFEGEVVYDELQN